ncbi:MAG: HNH endonuclease signature motif containing protein, partial [Candidatus Dormibacteraceae bacterium]
GGAVAIIDRTGQPVPGKLAQKIACDCQLTPVVVDEKGDVLHVGRRRRTFDWRQRLAIARRDGGCGWPGCDRLPGWCSGHHLRSWWEGGGPDLETAALLCGRHHTMVHQLG